MVDACSAAFDRVGEPDHREPLVDAITRTLEEADSGEQRDIVVRAATTFVRHRLRERLRDASTELAALTDLPPASLRTRAGWTAALRNDGHGARALDHLQTLPGTAVVLGVAEIVDIDAAIAHAAGGALHAELDSLWAATEPDSLTFDAVVDHLEASLPGAGRLGWALIRVETLKHVNLIWHQANKLERSFPERSASDLLSWGWVGLRTALRHYNPRLGFTFSTYACTRIIGSIRDGVRMESPIPKRLGTFQRKVAAVEAELTQLLGRTPTLEEVSQRVGAELSQLEVLRRTQTPLYIDETTAAEDGPADSGLLVEPTTVEDLAWVALCRDDIERALERLEPEDADAVRLLILNDMSPAEAREVTGATARQLRQRKERALQALREHLAHWDPAV